MKVLPISVIENIVLVYVYNNTNVYGSSFFTYPRYKDVIFIKGILLANH
jgi:hypothetical protein